VRLDNAHLKLKQMTPKEKATELVNKHFDYVEAWSVSNQIENAKQCALITVDEIIKQSWDYRDIDLGANYDFWNEVKTEIKKITA
jgi:hypothetical protein